MEIEGAPKKAASHTPWNVNYIVISWGRSLEEYVVSQKPLKNIFYSSKILLPICCFSKILLGIWCFSKSLWKVSFISQKSSEKYFLFPKNPPKNFLFFSKKNPSNSCATLRIVSFRLNSCFFRQALIVDKCRFLQRCFYHRSNFMWGHWRWYVLHQHLKIFLNILDILWGHWRRYVLHQPICLPVREGRA